MKVKLLLLAFLPLYLLSCEPKPIEEPDDPTPGPDDPEVVDPPAPEPRHVDPVALSFVEKGKYDINMSYDESAGEWQLTTTGTDPYIYAAGLSQDLEDEHKILSFDYKCTAGVDDLQVAFSALSTKGNIILPTLVREDTAETIKKNSKDKFNTNHPTEGWT